MLATNFDEKTDYKGWFLSEKLDGYRCFWDTKNFKSRNGNIFHLPQKIKTQMPKNIHLDGEIYIDKYSFEKLSILKKNVINEKECENMKFYLFDLPKVKCEYKDKINKMKMISQQYPYFIRYVEQIPMKNNKKIKNVFRKYIENDCEGVILRNPSSIYTKGRSKNLVKLKPMIDDEATIVGYNLNENNDLKSFKCKYKNNIINVYGLSQQLKKNYKRHKINDKITFQYSGLSNSGIPKYPRYKRKFT